MVDVTCLNCNTLFQKKQYEIKKGALKWKGRHFCCYNCYVEYQRKERINHIKDCVNCGKKFYKRPSEQKRTKNHFCSRSCAATYNNKNKTKGIRVSKLEYFLQEELIKIYSYDFHFNRKDTINSELDIYIPELKLAFELNGIFHYEPIYGDKKLKQIQNNDSRKFQACLEKQIELCIIDTSWLSYNSKSNMNKVLKIVQEVIEKSKSNKCFLIE
jgi:very-short-patch-repair endonuclease